ncbi:MAG: ABC transporter permease [Thiohalocapsa sp.]|uniref:FtsX-like permease family protein n=1 Tax=Thiohalocapsa sp. TaxID=2497641 RepID=UPI0025FF4545|nr:ABC transporter permease [Thiohalocapsa sp.]MCG6943670.1 ABC transporter permease [Thiohalocapsa sp.]
MSRGPGTRVVGALDAVRLPPALLTASRRYLTRHPWQTWLSIIGIALGVAVVIAVDLANESARRGFRLSVEQVAGPATHQIRAADGRIHDATYTRLRLAQGLDLATPVIEAPMRVGERSLTLLGLDLIAAAPMRPDLLAAGAGGADARSARAWATALIALLAEPDTLLLSAADAKAIGAAPGDEITVGIGSGERRMRVAAVLPDQQGQTLGGLAVTDIATAQEVTGSIGTVERIDLILTDAQADRLAAALPTGLRLTTTAQRTNALAQMTRAFHTNLTAMSLLAMLVGGFIVYNTMTFAVLQRRSLLGTLRMQGVTRGQLFALVLLETLVLAAIGSLLGVLMGIAVGAGLVQLVTRTINDIYFQLNVRSLHLDWLSLIKGVGLGVGVTLIAGLGPALEAARSQPRDVIRRTLVEQRGQRLLPWLALAGLVLIGLGVGLVPLSGRSMTWGFVALFLIIVGASLGMPLLVRVLAVATTPLFGGLFGSVGRLAARGITASITRSGLAVAALAVAVAATVGVGIMIGSFRVSVSDWLEHTLTSDIYIATEPGGGGGTDTSLPPALADELLDLPGVAAVSQGRRRPVETRTGQMSMLALTSSAGTPRGFNFRGETAENLWQRWRAGELALVSEPYAYRQGVGVGDRLELFTTQGWHGFEIGGVFQDYGSESGTVILSKPVYAKLWADPGVSSMGIVLADGADADAVEARVQAIAARLTPPAAVQTNRGIRALSLAIFDRTFTITEVLRLLAIGVAFVGILSALMALELERAKDYAVLRATGMTRGQLRLLILLQTTLMGTAAGLLAIPLGLAMGDLLIEVINLRSFGWTMPLRITPDTLAAGVLLAWVAAMLAGAYPALRAARAAPAQALREE